MIIQILTEIRIIVNILCKKRNNKKNILIVQLSGIGDSILALPFIEQLSKIDNLKIYVLTKTQNYTIYKNQNFIETIYTDCDYFILNNLIEHLNIDKVISIRSSISLLKYFLFAKIQFYPNPFFERLRLHTRIISKFSSNYKKKFYNSIHVVNLFNKHILKKNTYFNKLLPIHQEPLPDNLFKFIQESTKPVIFHFLGNDEIRKLNLNIVLDVINNIDGNLIILGTEEDKPFFNNDYILKKKHFNAFGLLNFNQIAQLVQLVNYSIVVDSSIMHISTLNLNMKMVALMGNASLSNYGPLIYNSNNLRIINRNPICSPCSKTTCGKFNGVSCIQDISALEILNEFENL
jgi:ADP-heptose:LPS heptosyltransferase